VINEKRKVIIRVELGTFHPESVQVVIEAEKLSIRCEEELQIDEKTTIVKRFTRRIPIQADQLRIDMIATQMNT
jgi:HSP20 family molecular chaperone IbpA